MTTTMTERFNVSGALLVSLFGRPEEESRWFSRTGRPGPRHRCHHRDVRPHLHRRPDPGRRAGAGPDLRAGRCAGVVRPAGHRVRGRAGAAVDPSLRPAHCAVERARRRDECAGLVRAGLRGAGSAADDRRESRTPSALRPGLEVDRVHRRALRLPERRPGLAGVAGEHLACRITRPVTQCCTA